MLFRSHTLQGAPKRLCLTLALCEGCSGVAGEKCRELQRQMACTPLSCVMLGCGMMEWTSREKTHKFGQGGELEHGTIGSPEYYPMVRWKLLGTSGGGSVFICGPETDETEKRLAEDLAGREIKESKNGEGGVHAVVPRSAISLAEDQRASQLSLLTC